MNFLERPEGRLAIALGIGLVIGAERERRKGEGPNRMPAGIRTFALVGLLGGVVGVIGSQALVAVAAAVVGALTIIAYYAGDRSDPGLTTESALFLTYCLGVLAEREPTVALAAGLCTATLLAFRTSLHQAMQHVLSEDELRDALLFGVAAVVVLPLLPNRAIDPFHAFNPFVLWRLVVLLMGMSGAGYIAQRIIGPRYGLALAGFGAGFISSSATIAAMGARAKGDAEVLQPAVAGAAASTVATFVQMAILVGAASPPLLLALAWPLGAGATAALAYAAMQTWQARRADAEPSPGRAFKLSTALVFALLVTSIAFVSALAQRAMGPAGAVVTAALAGFADAHASSAAVASVADQLGLFGAILGVLLALTTNSITKMVLAVTSGPRGYWARVVIGQILVLVVTWGVAGLRLILHL
ncbi:MAG: MgtC/SapB family protein [Acidobacteriota bacterium]|nr:MgtC/SapB family protein [Acidobacteriota bacterium]